MSRGRPGDVSPPAGLSSEIGRADRAGLLALVAERLAALTERDVLQCLRHPYASEELVGLVLSSRVHLSARSVRRALALHPSTPRPDAIRCLQDLTWRDLALVGREVRAAGPVRRAANRRLLEMLPRLSRGEKVALARLADAELFPALLDGEERDVFDALLENARLREEDLTAWILARSPDPGRLERLSRSARWEGRPAVRAALLASPRTPRAVALGLLPRASREEWARLAGDRSADPLLSACARRLLLGDGDVDSGDDGQ